MLNAPAADGTLYEIFGQPYSEVMFDCANNNFVAAAHKITTFGETHGQHLMLALVIIVVTALSDEHRVNLSHAFYSKQVGFSLLG